MTENLVAERRLSSELDELKSVLRAQPLPPPEESAMRSAFRARQRALAGAGVAAGERRRSPRPRRVQFALAASVAVAAIVTAAIVGSRGEVPRATPPLPVAAAVANPSERSGVTAFQPLMYSPGFSPTASYSVVRVRIPLASLALVPGTTADGMIEAELLVGEDGLARGIRFNPAAALLATAATEE